MHTVSLTLEAAVDCLEVTRQLEGSFLISPLPIFEPATMRLPREEGTACYGRTRQIIGSCLCLLRDKILSTPEKAPPKPPIPGFGGFEGSVSTHGGLKKRITPSKRTDTTDRTPAAILIPDRRKKIHPVKMN